MKLFEPEVDIAKRGVRGSISIIPSSARCRCKALFLMREVWVMPEQWTNKDERQYEHVRDEQRSRGKSSARAKEIAGRTVNKQRRQEGRTPLKTTQGTGNPNTPLEARTRKELYNRAADLQIRGRSSMSKSELIDAIRNRR